LEWFVAPAPLRDADFHDVEGPVIVEGTLTGLHGDHLAGLADKHRTKVEPYVQQGRLRVRRTQTDASAKKADIALELRDPVQPDGADNAWKPNPSGIESAFKALFPEPINSGAFEYAAADATKAKNNFTIGKPLGNSGSPAPYGGSPNAGDHPV
jgi:hypothetical protein